MCGDPTDALEVLLGAGVPVVLSYWSTSTTALDQSFLASPLATFGTFLFLVLPLRGILAYFLTGWWGIVPVEILDGLGTGLQSVAAAHGAGGCGV